MTYDKETIQDIIHQIEVMQIETLRKNKNEKNKKVVNFEIFKETKFKLMVGREALKNERKRLAKLDENESKQESS